MTSRTSPHDTPTAAASPDAARGDAALAPETGRRRVDASRLAARLALPVRRWPIDLVDVTGSTNADLLVRLRDDPSQAPAARLAYTQEAGRGQRGRAWQSVPGDSLTFSVAYAMPGGPARLAGLSLATGVAVVEALSDLPLSRPQAVALKWPNDVLLAGRKLAGILIETVPAGQGRTGVVIGIGINLRQAEALSARMAAAPAGASTASAGAAQTNAADLVPATQPAALEEVLAEPDMTTVFAALLNRLAPMLDRFATEGFAPFRDDWETMHAFANAPVRLIERGRDILHGIALGVDMQGCLRVATDNGERVIASGEVSLRPAGPGGPARTGDRAGDRE
ncbi:biotin--protein ligase [Pandoraea terrae]|uniref:biotin--[biotin carboxyl-carrier protein] ligase n=1 Tax=Pandoraea terrae TaxID=1537710 RepID=A0A5E4YDZ0_9BURK|nr:biotin--[acetyl-CoA-carboxylase] ligase [Pandoraea terrae]VVE46904.1 biotin--protein ligase [Pandoraea terrae]